MKNDMPEEETASPVPDPCAGTTRTEAEREPGQLQRNSLPVNTFIARTGYNDDVSIVGCFSQERRSGMGLLSFLLGEDKPNEKVEDVHVTSLGRDRYVRVGEDKSSTRIRQRHDGSREIIGPLNNVEGKIKKGYLDYYRTDASGRVVETYKSSGYGKYDIIDSKGKKTGYLEVDAQGRIKKHTYK